MSYKKWIYKYQFLQEEIVDLKEQEKDNIKEFNDYFSLDEEEAQNNPPKIEDLPPEKTPDNPGKSLYKALSKKLHPDRGGDKDEFASISIMYRNQDTIGLFLKAEELEMDTEKYLTEELINSFEKSCDLVEDEANVIKNTLSWHWCNAESELEKKMQLSYLKKEFNLIPKEDKK